MFLAVGLLSRGLERSPGVLPQPLYKKQPVCKNSQPSGILSDSRSLTAL
ncbi:MAG: hypothetical protein HC925_04390 [Coleofasciculaceae cyanobacterium SM2_3_26]|nr:hypothetical protein [Coleofasciculaceae cyanobacterium SM2_3_26]